MTKIINIICSTLKPEPIYVTEKEFLKGREKKYPLSWKLKNNMRIILKKINVLRRKYGKPFIISSGYRPAEYNRNAGGSSRSAHLTCEAIDIRDPDRRISVWLLNNRDLLEELDLYMEDSNYTKGWVHLQTRRTRSGKRVFIP